MTQGQRVWLIGGTSESRVLAAGLLNQGLGCVVTVTTGTATGLYEAHPLLRVQEGILTTAVLPDFLQRHHIGAIVDASHPFATEITRTAMAIAREESLPYLRFERPSLDIDEDVDRQTVPDFPSLLQDPYWAQLRQKRVFLTIGAKRLQHFQAVQDQAIFFARILPQLASLQQAIAAGFTPDRIIALRPPISDDLEKALWEQWEIEVVVTKASGMAGGEDRKYRLAQQMGIVLMRVARPSVCEVSQAVTDDPEQVYAFCRRHCEAPSV